jgi:hypothetical protein
LVGNPKINDPKAVVFWSHTGLVLPDATLSAITNKNQTVT